MKSAFRFIITRLLACRARRHLKKHHTQVIAVTGSVGKTTTKEAIYCVLKNRFDVYCGKSGFNTEIGISLAILGEEKSGFSSAREWLKILYRALFLPKKGYKKIILEMGADHPGDIKKLVRIARPHISVITHVAGVHLEKGQFSGLEDIAKEKSALIQHLKPGDIAILNEDDPFIRAMRTRAKRFTYGAEGQSTDLYASEVKTCSRHTTFKAHYKESVVSFKVPVIGGFQVYSLLPAISVGIMLGLNLQECADALSEFRLPPGRMNPIKGVNDSLIIDSSYNASPRSMNAALDTLGELDFENKIAAIGTMNELGETAKEAHIELGKKAATVANQIFAVGPEAANIKIGALQAGMPENSIYTFFDAEDAGRALKEKLTPKDLVLVKGSQNRVRMEKLVKIIMDKPEKAGELLCRQEKEWENI